MGIALIINKCGNLITFRNGQQILKTTTVSKIAIGEKTHYNKRTKKPYTTFNFKKEKELLKFIYDTYGEGRYIIIANMKGRLNVFWKGTVSEDG